MLNSRVFRLTIGVGIISLVVLTMGFAFYGLWFEDLTWISRAGAMVALLVGAKFLYEVALLVDKYKQVGNLIDDIKKKFSLDTDLDEELEDMFKGYM